MLYVSVWQTPVCGTQATPDRFAQYWDVPRQNLSRVCVSSYNPSVEHEVGGNKVFLVFIALQPQDADNMVRYNQLHLTVLGDKQLLMLELTRNNLILSDLLGN